MANRSLPHSSRSFPQQIKGVNGNYGVRISNNPDLYKFEIHCFPDNFAAVNGKLKRQIGVTIPEQPRAIISNKSVRSLWLAPQKALIVSQNPLNIDIASKQALLVDQSDGRMGCRITGEWASYVLKKGISVDLQGSDFVIQTSLHGMSLIIVAINNGFDIYYYRSFADSFNEWLLQASLEYGYLLE